MASQTAEVPPFGLNEYELCLHDMEQEEDYHQRMILEMPSKPLGKFAFIRIHISKISALSSRQHLRIGLDKKIISYQPAVPNIKYLCFPQGVLKPYMLV